MITEQQKKLLADVILEFGIDRQIDQAIEECAELIAVLEQYRRKRVTGNDVRTEIADVQIMSEQLACVFGPESVEKERNAKLKRLQERLIKYREKQNEV